MDSSDPVPLAARPSGPARRVATEVATILVITIVLSLAGLALVTGRDAATADEIVPDAARVLFGALGIGLLLWSLLLVAGAIVLRERGPALRIVVHMLTAALAITLNAAIVALATGAGTSAGSGEWGDLVVAIVLGAGLVVLGAAVIAVVVTELVVVRSPRQAMPSAFGEQPFDSAATDR